MMFDGEENEVVEETPSIEGEEVSSESTEGEDAPETEGEETAG